MTDFVTDSRWAPVIIVSGLPRCGTSMLMQMLQAGGVVLLADEKRGPDADNPNGYFEWDAVKRLPVDQGWLKDAKGRAVKIVGPLLRYLPVDLSGCVLIMERDIDEVIASQLTMLKRQGLEPPYSQDALKASYGHYLLQINEWLVRRPHLRALKLQHHEIISGPLRMATQVAAFLGMPLNVESMAAVVKPELYRQRTDRIKSPPRA